MADRDAGSRSLVCRMLPRCLALVATAVALMVGNLGRLQGGPLLSVVFLLAGAAVLLQSLPLTDCGLQLLPSLRGPTAAGCRFLFH